MSGKIKTVAYISACALALLAVSLRRISPESRFGPVVLAAAVAVFAVSVVLAVVSFADYVKVYRGKE
jgi:phosphatidylglycerophosphate synthase